MKIQMSSRELPDIFKTITTVERVWSTRYETGIGSTSIGIYDVEVDEIKETQFLSNYRSGYHEWSTANIYVFGGRYVLGGREHSPNDIQKILNEEVLLLWEEGGDLTLAPLTCPIDDEAGITFRQWKQDQSNRLIREAQAKKEQYAVSRALPVRGKTKRLQKKFAKIEA